MIVDAPERDMPVFSVSEPDDVSHGNYATNVALLLADSLRKSPMDIANELASKLTNDMWCAEAAAPGFVNFFLADAFLMRELAEGVLEKKETWGTSTAGAGKTVVVEYFQLNIAKRPHIGHMRTGIIGDALKRMFAAGGYHAVSDTHVGDWGTQFGILLLAYKENITDDIKPRIAEDPFAFLEDIYKKENKKIEEEPERRERAKAEFAKLERGDKENRDIWQWMVAVSMKKLEEGAHRLDLLPFDEHKGESAYENDMARIVDEAITKGVAKNVEGAVLVDLTGERLGEAVLRKSDGASTYLLRDLATIAYRKKQWRFWKNIYVVDVRQEYHFRQVFRVADLLGYNDAGVSEHVSYGEMRLPEGSMSTRKGTVIALDALFDEAYDRARAIIDEKNPDLSQADTIAHQVGIGAIKYFDLSHNRKSDIVFTWDNALSFDGDTGPYIQYTHARLKSILRKAKSSKISLPNTVKMEEKERALVVRILRFPEAITDALADYAPHIIAGYVFVLAKTTNDFYHACPVLTEEHEEIRQFRLALVDAAATTLKKGLYLLGIDAPEEM